MALCAAAAWSACSSPTTNPDVVVGNDVPPGSDVPPGTDGSRGTDVQTGTDVQGPDVPVSPTGGVSILTFGGDAQRTLANRAETALTVSAVHTMGRMGKDPAFTPPDLDGDIYSEPLYVANQMIAGVPRDVVYVGTQNNTVYALDAAVGGLLWQTNLGTAVLLSQQADGNLPQTGVQGGMVIDPASHTLYAVAYTRPGAANVFTINALDLGTGEQRSGYPQPIAPPASNGSTWNPFAQGERGAITLVGGRIYVPFGGLYGDRGTYHGWVVGIDPATPTHQTAFATPANLSGIWAPGGIASDGTNLYVATGNGSSASAMGEYIMRLAGGASGPTITSSDTTAYFTPSNRISLDASDTDIGSNAPVVLPDQTTSTPHLVFEGGKAGIGYLLNRDNLGGMGTGDGRTGEGVFSAQISSSGVYGAAASWSNGTHTYVFVPVHGNRATPCTGSGGVVALQLGAATGGASNFTTAWCSAASGEGAPAVSSNGNNDGILWVTFAPGGRLDAYDISTGMMIWTANDAGPVRKWVPPMIANGRVYVTNSASLTMYRLLH